MGLVIGGMPRFRLAQQPDPTEKPEARPKLHHQLGHDPKERARHLRVVDGVPDQSLTRCLAYVIWRVQIVEKIARDEAFEKIGVALSTLNDRICRVRCRT